jgi:uncharacterized Zn-finger protein
MKPPEILQVNSTVFSCDGGDDVLGHPRVFLNMGNKTKSDCPYCGRQYILGSHNTHS